MSELTHVDDDVWAAVTDTMLAEWIATQRIVLVGDQYFLTPLGAGYVERFQAQMQRRPADAPLQ